MLRLLFCCYLLLIIMCAFLNYYHYPNLLVCYLGLLFVILNACLVAFVLFLFSNSMFLFLVPCLFNVLIIPICVFLKVVRSLLFVLLLC